MKLRGLPFNIKQSDIQIFFKSFDFYEEIKIGKNSDNTKTGEGAILFKSEDECKKAFLNKQGQNIAHRWVELYRITVEEFRNLFTLQGSK